MTKIVLPSQTVHVDEISGVDPIWYEKLQTLIARVNALEAFVANGAYSQTAYTPVLTSAGGTAPTFTAVPLSGAWVRLGSLVFVSVAGSNVAGGTPGAGAQQLSISLPKAVNATAPPSRVTAGSYLNGATESMAFAEFDAGAITAALYKQTILGANANQAALTGADFNNATRAISWRFFYGIDGAS